MKKYLDTEKAVINAANRLSAAKFYGKNVWAMTVALNQLLEKLNQFECRKIARDYAQAALDKPIRR